MTEVTPSRQTSQPLKLVPVTEFRADRMKALAKEQKALGDEMVADALTALRAAALAAEDLGKAGEGVMPGVREFAAKTAADLYARIDTIVAIHGRR